MSTPDTATTFDIFDPDQIATIRMVAEGGRDFTFHADTVIAALDKYESLVLLVQDLAHELLQIEAHCPCGARPETIKTHPHVSGCPVATGLAKWEAWAVPQPGAEVTPRKVDDDGSR